MVDVRSDLQAARARRRRKVMVAASVVVVASLALALGALVASGALQPDEEVDRAATDRPATTTSTSRPLRDETPRCGARLTADDPLWLWIGGDSLAGTLGPSLGEEAGATGVVQPVYDSRVSSGLSTPDFFDWPEHATDPETEVVRLDPDVVVFIIGANDWRAVTASSAWEQQYAKQVEEMLTILEGGRADRHVYWVGSPVLQEKRKDAGAQQVNAVAKRVVDAHPRATYVDAYTLFSDSTGKYAASLPDDTGKTVRVRAGDGVHLTDAGGDRLGDAVLALIDERCDVRAHAIEGPSKPVLQAEGSDGPGGGSGDESGGSTPRSGSGGTIATTSPPVMISPAPAPAPAPEPVPETQPEQPAPDTEPTPTDPTTPNAPGPVS